MPMNVFNFLKRREQILLEQRVYKNYKQLCKAMNWKVTSSDSKNKQFKELTSICKWHKEGNKIKSGIQSPTLVKKYTICR